MKVPETVQHPQMNAYLHRLAQPQRPQGDEAAAAGQGRGAAPRPRRDVVEISPQSRLAREAAAVQPAQGPQETSRAQKVQALKAQVQAGTYRVNPIKVADAMMKELIKGLG